ncbi:MAG: pilus assembly protein N-terminal domain-containing protein [Syntrophobacterales bacterium]|nr:pilus assembly protein N-terminal domain-containing protein [Syntrophobacterales bacterium]
MLKVCFKFNSAGKITLLLFAWLLFANFSPAHALDEYSPGTEKLSDAEDLELTAGKSFILECDEEAVRLAVGQPKIAEVRALSPKEVLINALRPGTTNIIIWHRDETTSVYNLTVKYDVSEIKKKLKEMVPGAEVTLTTSYSMLKKDEEDKNSGENQNSGDGMLMISGQVDDQETMDRILRVVQAFVDRDYIKNLLRLKGPQQVQLEARIVEVSRSSMKKYGLGFLLHGTSNGNLIGGGLLPPGIGGRGGGYSSGGGGVNMNLQGIPGTPGSTSTTQHLDGSITTVVNPAMAAHFTMDSTFPMASPFTNAFQIAFHLLDDDISGILSLLKSQGLATIMARPTLVAMSGQEASFHVGGSFPVPVTGSYGTTGFNDKKYGVELEFVPTVTGKETINLVVTTSISDIDYSTSVTSGGATVPGVVSREASSTLQIKDGQTFAIAGLLKEKINSVVNKVPFLGDIPVLGVLFRSKDYLKEETELIIMVTPRLVKAMNKNEIPPLPGEMEDFNQGDFEFFFLDRMWKKKRSTPEKNPRFSGPVGFEN